MSGTDRPAANPGQITARRSSRISSGVRADAELVSSPSNSLRGACGVPGRLAKYSGLAPRPAAVATVGWVCRQTSSAVSDRARASYGHTIQIGSSV